MTGRDRAVLIVVLAIAALAAGWLLVVQPKRATAAKLGASVQTEQAQLTTVEGKVAADEQARASFPAEYAQIAQLGEAVPEDDEVPSLIYELQSAAKASSVDFQGLQLTAAGASGTGTSSTSSSGTSGNAATLAPGVSTAGAGFDAEQFTFTFSGNYFNLSDFLRRLDSFVVANGSTVRVSGRLMTLNAITLAPAPHGSRKMVADVSATTYLLPASQGLLDGATAAGPAEGSPAGIAGLAGGAGSQATPAPAGGTGITPAPAAAVPAPATTGVAR